MKKTLITFATIMILSSNVYGEMKDGKYSAKEEKYSFWGWKGYLNVDVKNGKIASVEFDHENKDGKKQTEDKSYNDNMYKSKKVNPKMFTDKFEKESIDKQGFEKIDGIAGATQSKDKFIQMGKLLMDKIEKGESGNYILKKSKLEKEKNKDGVK